MIDAVPVEDEVVVEYPAPEPTPFPVITSVVNTSSSASHYVIEYAPVEVTVNNTCTNNEHYDISTNLYEGNEEDDDDEEPEEPVFLPHYGGYRDAAVLSSSLTSGTRQAGLFARIKSWLQSLSKQRSIKSVGALPSGQQS